MKINIKETLDAKEKEQKRKEIMTLADTIQGEINRMCVTNSLTELDTMYHHALANMKKLYDMIYYKEFVEEEI